MATQTQPTSLLSIKAVAARTGLARATIYAAVARSEFPKPVCVSRRRIGFVSTEIDAFIEGCIAQRDRTSAARTARAKVQS